MGKLKTEDVVAKYVEVGGNVSETARQLGISRGGVQHHLNMGGVTKPVAGGRVEGEIKTESLPLPEKGKVKRFLLTCAQNNTRVHAGLWDNLLALKKHYGAEVLVSRITYNVSAYTAQPEKPGTKRAPTAGPTDASLWYDPAVAEYVSDKRVEIAPGLVWCGELNILPTATRPLSGLESYTGRKSAIVPHVKFALESIPSGKYEDTKFNYTTGTVTQMSYIQRKAGQKAEHHHCYGALMAEVDHLGRWFVRQLNADSKGTIYDLELKVEGGKVSKGHWVEAVNWGDIHEDELDEEVRRLAWGQKGMMDTLRPRHQFMHDALSFNRRNHHDRKNCHKMFEKFIRGKDEVEDEIKNLVRFLNEESYRPWCRTIVVNSNHDNALERWLREADYKTDPVNAVYFLTCQKRKYEAIKADDRGFYIVEWAAREAGCKGDIRWLKEDESYLICRDIECGMHGHLGPNGTRGTPLALSKMGRKANTGHTHKTGIIDGLYTSGTSSERDLGYNQGPGAWSHSHILTYENGKRSIVTMWQGAWRA